MTHEPQFRRYPRGMSIPFNRPLYGYRVICACGWEQRINGNKREAARIHRHHRLAEEAK